MKSNPLTILRNFRPGKTWIILGVALAIGLLAALTARSYLSSQMAAIEARGKGQTMLALVAKADLPKGAVLSKENVAVRPIPIEFAHSVALTPDDFDRVSGQPLAYAVKGGEMILWGLMETAKVPTFSARVENGRRAMTVPVDEINSISGMLEPGDLIDLMLTMDRGGQKITFALLQSVEVMATGTRSVDDPQGGRTGYSTVTLDTTPEEAQNIIVARDSGKLTALLRNPGDKTQIGKGSYDMAALLGQRAGPSMPGSARRAVPVIYGGASGTLAPEAANLRRFGGPAASEDSEESKAQPAAASGAPAGPRTLTQVLR